METIAIIYRHQFIDRAAAIAAITKENPTPKPTQDGLVEFVHHHPDALKIGAAFDDGSLMVCARDYAYHRRQLFRAVRKLSRKKGVQA